MSVPWLISCAARSQLKVRCFLPALRVGCSTYCTDSVIKPQRISVDMYTGLLSYCGRGCAPLVTPLYPTPLPSSPHTHSSQAQGVQDPVAALLMTILLARFGPYCILSDLPFSVHRHQSLLCKQQQVWSFTPYTAGEMRDSSIHATVWCVNTSQLQPD